MIADWGQVFDLVLAGGLGSAGTLLVSRVLNRKSGNNSNGNCVAHYYMQSDIDEIKRNYISKEMCNQKHMELVRRIDELKDVIDRNHDVLISTINQLSK